MKYGRSGDNKEHGDYTLVGRCQFIANNKSGLVFFFLELRTCIGVTSIDTPREQDAVSRQRDASKHYIFSTLLQQPPYARTPCTLTFYHGPIETARPAIRASLAALLCGRLTTAARHHPPLQSIYPSLASTFFLDLYHAVFFPFITIFSLHFSYFCLRLIVGHFVTHFYVFIYGSKASLIQFTLLAKESNGNRCKKILRQG